MNHHLHCRPTCVRSISLCLAGQLVAACAATALGQVNPQPPADISSYQPQEIKPEFRTRSVWRDGGPSEPIKGSVPPADWNSIVPMPMAQPTPKSERRVASDLAKESVTLYDATTGIARVLPLAEGAPPLGGSGIGAYIGMDGASEQGEPTNWSAQMSAVSPESIVAYPARTNVKLVMRFIDQKGESSYSGCSGSMLDSGVVLTAGHCVFSHNNSRNIADYAEEIWVLPAWDGVGAGGNLSDAAIKRHFGYARATQWIVGTAWVEDADFDRDVAALRLKRSETRNVGMVTGWMGWVSNNCNQSKTYHNYSYPGEFCAFHLHTGRQMYYWADTVDDCPGVVWNQFDMHTTGGCLGAGWGGMSGSSLYEVINSIPYAAAVSSTSNRDDRAYYCGIWGQFGSDLEGFKTSTRGNVFDAEPLRLRMVAEGAPAPVVPEGGMMPAGSVLVANATNNNPAPRTITLRVYLSSDADITTGDALLETYTYNNVDFAAMGSVQLNIPSTEIPFLVPQGTQYVGVILDGGTDNNSSNNDSDGWDAQAISVGPCVAPLAINNLSASDGTSCGHVYLLWTPVANAGFYQIWRSNNNNFANATLIAEPAENDYYDATANAQGATQYYWVRAASQCNYGGFAPVTDGFRRAAVLFAPGNFVASQGTQCNHIALSWAAATHATTYSVYRNTATTFAGSTLMAITAGLSYNDVSATPGQTYYYFVRGGNICGSGLSGGPAAGAAQGMRQTPALAPGQLDASDTICQGIEVSWLGFSNSVAYLVYRNTVNNSATAINIGVNNGGANNTYFDNTAAPNIPYYYWVRASNACGLSAFSAVNAGLRGTTVPAPTGVAASEGGPCRATIDVTWNPTPGASSYAIFRSLTNVVGTAIQVGAVAGPTVMWSDANASLDTTYYYWVKAFSPCNTISGFSASNSGNRGVQPGMPQNVRASDGTACGFVSVSWDAVPGAGGYRIFRGATPNPNASVEIGVDNASAYPDVTAQAGEVYYYFVKATSNCGDSSTSRSDSGFTGEPGTIITQPVDTFALVGGSANFFVEATNATGYIWYHDGEEVIESPLITGTQTQQLNFHLVAASDAGLYHCVILNPCETLLSARAFLLVDSTACAADYNDDGGVDGADVDAFFADWSEGSPFADVNLDGGVDGADVDEFFIVWAAGGCV